jgi:hypothetical protein
MNLVSKEQMNNLIMVMEDKHKDLLKSVDTLTAIQNVLSNAVEKADESLALQSVERKQVELMRDNMYITNELINKTLQNLNQTYNEIDQIFIDLPNNNEKDSNYKMLYLQ